VRELNPNAYVYLLQARMSDLGLYRGRKNGQLTTATIQAISRFCQMKQVQRICGRGPLSGEAASVLGFTFRSANFAASALQSSARDTAVSQNGTNYEEITGRSLEILYRSADAWQTTHLKTPEIPARKQEGQAVQQLCAQSESRGIRTLVGAEFDLVPNLHLF